MLRNLSKLRSVFRKNAEFQCGVGGEIYGPDHKAMQESLQKIIDNDINPYVDEWEAARMYPAHEVIKKLGDGGFLGKVILFSKPLKLFLNCFFMNYLQNFNILIIIYLNISI
jgi:hypothetical protein